MLTDPWFYAVAIPAVALFGLTKGGFAGASLPAMPLMALMMPPFTAAAIILPVLLVQDIVTVYSFRKEYDRTMLRLMLPGAVVGSLVGSFTAASIQPDHVRFGVGLLAFAFCLNAWFGPGAGKGGALPHDPAMAGFWGGVSGFTSFVIHAGGAPFNIYALPRRLPKEVLSGTAAIFFSIVNLMKVPAYLGLGQLTLETLKLSAVLLPAAILANAGGIWLVRRMPLGMFYRVLYGLLFGLSLKLIFDGVKSLAGL
jgi:uncharacterized protein